jgi:hypothetical protein
MPRALFIGGPWDGRFEAVTHVDRDVMVPERDDDDLGLVLRPDEQPEFRPLEVCRYRPWLYTDGRRDFLLMTTDEVGRLDYAVARGIWEAAENPRPVPVRESVSLAEAAANVLRDFDRRQREEQRDFVALLRALLIEERGHSEEDADRLIRTHTGIVVNGIMAGPFNLRACAIALEMADEASAPV